MILHIQFAGQQKPSLAELSFWMLRVHINYQLDLKYSNHFVMR